MFVAEWFDNQAQLVRNYYLTFFDNDGTIEIYDIKNKRIFLKKTEVATVNKTCLFIGSVLTVFGRQFKIIEFGDAFTKKKFDFTKGKTFAMIKPDAYTNIGKILDIVEQHFRISKIKMVKFTKEIAEEFYAEHKGKPFFEELVNFICSDLAVGLELVCDDAI